jgi:hypothetical protein
MLLPERASAVRRRAGLVDLAADHAAATVAGLLAVDASRLPLILVDGADAHASSDRSALVDLVTDAHDSGRALVLAVGDADLLPARHLRVAVSASPTALRPDEVRVGA